MLGTLTLEDAAKEAAGNWQRFDSLVWWREREMDDADRWAIVYTSNRDSGLLDQSNAAVIAKTLEALTEGHDPDVVAESHSHWLVGHVDGYSIRVLDADGNITEAFRTYFELQERLSDYPVLDESHYSDIEYEATLENIPLAAWKLKDTFVLPNDWECEVHGWLLEHRCNALENTDDRGGWPSEDDLEAAFAGLGYERVGEGT